MRTEQAADWLMGRITGGSWPLHSQIPTESELADQLGVGRSTVREAVRSLVQMGMLETARGRGTFVRATSPVNTVLSEYLQAHSAEAILELRRAVEVEAAGLAAVRRTAQQLTDLESDLARAESLVGTPVGDRPDRVPGKFHRDLVAAAHNPLLLDVYAGLLGALQHAVNDGRVRLAPGRTVTALGEHRQLLDAIRDQDTDRARTIAAAHTDAEFETVHSPVPAPRTDA
ncbi:FCD domain-containing protein [Nakamurella sp. YIM 132087]|uniref:FCD domain-containing protein n=1 Tax=Nakamurella alba TaxID=2665158 RepID=A0A7K1FLB7_9ACTN|nr:FadR/GntR family transcriptional regulator [Nakamurella alba]MTD14898.1 FCD domain-containing protein [Nakamurella alba]